jgi:hypothetical protein
VNCLIGAIKKSYSSGHQRVIWFNISGRTRHNGPSH